MTSMQEKIIKFCYLCLMALFTLLYVMNSPSGADVTRSCTATYSVGISGISGVTNLTYPFEGRGTVGYFNPNEARERARHNLDECITAHWENRNMTGRPSQCTESNQIYNYPFTIGLIPKIVIDVCSSHKSYESFTMGLSVLFAGDTGCLLDRNVWSRSVVSNYRVNCPDYEYEANTDRPGGDYRDFNLDRADWHLCVAECNGDARCRAWTYVKAGVQGPSARCWLKSTVPDKGPSTCCDSGVKIIP